MALTNAERQARYRQRLRERASPSGLAVVAGQAADHAVAVMWAYIERTGLSDADGCDDLAAFRREVASDEAGLPGRCRDYLSDPDDLTAEEVAAFSAVLDAYDALTLAADRPKKAKRQRR